MENDVLAIAQYCLHSERPAAARMCAHVIGNEYVQTYSGEGLFYELICEECEKLSADDLQLENVCSSCLLAFEGERHLPPERMNGTPQVFERSSELFFVHEIVAVTWPKNSTIMALPPINSEAKVVCLALTDAGHLLRINTVNEKPNFVAALPADKLDLAAKFTLIISADGKWAAIANTHGHHGLVVELASGNVTMTLERDDYQIAHSQFPIAFFQYQEQTLLVHGTTWNRLDISDPQTGKMLTERAPKNDKEGERPEHYLDYFHASLSVSPNQEWIVDNGWVWHPVGIVRAWHIPTWLQENVWESEDGGSVQELCWREYLWDGTLCWIDDTTLAVWGIGKDDAQMIDGVRLFDVITGKELRWFAGPDNTLEFDEYLFSHSEKNGMSVWDIETGERLLQDETLIPSCYHQGARQFVTLLSDGSIQLSRLHKN